MPKIIEFEGKEIEVPDDATDEEVAGILEQYAPEAREARVERSVDELREQGAMGFGPQDPVPAYDKKPGDFPRAPLPVEMRTPEERYAERYKRAAALYMETAGESGQRDSDKAAGEFHRIFPPGTPPERLESFIAAQEAARETMAREGGTAARIVRPLIALSEGVLAEDFTDSPRLGAGGRAAIERSRAEDGALMRVAEGTARGLGSAAALMGTPGAGLPAQLGKAALYGAAADTEDPVRGAVTMPAMLAAGGLGARALAGANPSALRSLGAGALTGPPAGIATRAIAGQETTVENVAEDAALEALFAAVGLPGALRRRPALPVAEAGRVKQEAVDRGLARPEEAFSEKAAGEALDAIEAGRSPVEALEARQPLPAKEGGTDAGYKPTERAIADGDVAPEAIPLVRAVEAKGADAVASGVTDVVPYVIARAPDGRAIVERGEPAPNPTQTQTKPNQTNPAERAASEALDRLTGRPQGEPTGIKNAVVNAERAARGVEPLPEAPVESHPEVVSRARASIVDNPNRARELVQEVTKKPRNLSTEEEAVLDIHRVDTKRAFERADKEGQEAAARGDAEAVADALSRRTQASEDFAAMEEATKAAGREWGRSGSFRRRLMADDYSLVKMESDLRAAQDFKPLTPEQQAEVRALHERVTKSDAKAAAMEERLAAVEAKRALAKVAQRARTTKYGETNKVVSREAYEAAKARLRAKGLQLNSGFDVTMIADAAQMGAFHLEAGLRGFARWSSRMLKDFGEQVRPHLRAIYSESLKQAPKVVDETGLSEAGKIAELVMRDGVRNREKVIDEVHAILKETSPEVTRRQVMDAISGYGKVRPLNPDPIKAELRELKGQMQQLGKLADMAAGKAPLKSGPERQAPGDEQRRLIKEVNEAKRQGGYDVKDPAAQLRTALDATKTRLKNDIADLDRQIAAGKRDLPQRTPAPTDAEVVALKAKRDALREALDTLDPAGVKARSDAQKIAASVKAVEKSIAEHERKVAAGDISRPAPKKGPTDARLDALRARRDALKVRLDDIRAVAEQQTPWPQEVEAKRIKNALKAVERSTAEYERRVRENDLEPQRKADEAFEARKRKALVQAEAERATAREAWRERLEADRLKNMTRWQKLKALPGATFNFLRAVKTSFDLSSLLNQGGILGISNPTLLPGALKRGAGAFVSADSAARSKAERMQDPDYALSQRAGLFLGDKAAAGPARAEEMFSSRLAEKVPGLAGSGRGYTEALNAMRFPAFKKLLRSFSFGQEPSLDFAKDVANYVNIAAGRGHLGRFEAAVPAGNLVFWATRNLVSRVQFLLGQPLLTAQTWRGRAVISKEYAKFFAGVAALYAVAKAAGADIEEDPRSSDFGKIRFGNTRVDPYGGLQQFVVLEERARSGQIKTTGGKVKPSRLGDTLQRFGRSKLAPIPGTAWEVVEGRDYAGQETTPGSVAKNLTLPMVIEDVAESIKEHGPVKGAALGALSIFGVRVSTFEARKRGR